MKLTSNSTARRRTASALLRSRGGPQIPSPVRRIAPKPRRWIESSRPRQTFPARLAETSFLFTITSMNLVVSHFALFPELLLISTQTGIGAFCSREHRERQDLVCRRVSLIKGRPVCIPMFPLALLRLAFVHVGHGRAA